MAITTPGSTTSHEGAVISKHLRDRLRHGVEMEEGIVVVLTCLCLDSLPPKLPEPTARRITAILKILRDDSA
jgi:hypothetical protein